MDHPPNCVCVTCTFEFIPASAPSRCPVCNSEHICHQCRADDQEREKWVCAACTLMNLARNSVCEVCGHMKPIQRAHQRIQEYEPQLGRREPVPQLPAQPDQSNSPIIDPVQVADPQIPDRPDGEFKLEEQPRPQIADDGEIGFEEKPLRAADDGELGLEEEPRRQIARDGEFGFEEQPLRAADDGELGLVEEPRRQIARDGEFGLEEQPHLPADDGEFVLEEQPHRPADDGEFRLEESPRRQIADDGEFAPGVEVPLDGGELDQQWNEPDEMGLDQQQNEPDGEFELGENTTTRNLGGHREAYEDSDPEPAVRRKDEHNQELKSEDSWPLKESTKKDIQFRPEIQEKVTKRKSEICEFLGHFQIPPDVIRNFEDKKVTVAKLKDLEFDQLKELVTEDQHVFFLENVIELLHQGNASQGVDDNQMQELERLRRLVADEVERTLSKRPSPPLASQASETKAAVYDVLKSSANLNLFFRRLRSIAKYSKKVGEEASEAKVREIGLDEDLDDDFESDGSVEELEDLELIDMELYDCVLLCIGHFGSELSVLSGGEDANVKCVMIESSKKAIKFLLQKNKHLLKEQHNKFRIITRMTTHEDKGEVRNAGALLVRALRRRDYLSDILIYCTNVSTARDKLQTCGVTYKVAITSDPVVATDYCGCDPVDHVDPDPVDPAPVDHDPVDPDPVDPIEMEPTLDKRIESKAEDEIEEKHVTEEEEEEETFRSETELPELTTQQLKDELTKHGKSGRKGNKGALRKKLTKAYDDDREKLFGAISKSDENELINYLRRGLDVNKLWKMYTPLRKAATEGSLQIVRLLLEANADANIIDQHGTTALYVASFIGRVDVVTTLINAGCEVEPGRHPVEEITDKEKNVEIVIGKNECSPVFVAAQQGHQEVVEKLLDSKALIDFLSKDGATPLYIACEENRLNVVEMLIKRNADPTIKKADKSTPLYIAAQNGCSEIVKYILPQDGVQVDDCKEGGYSPLYISCDRGHIDVVKMLLEGNANIHHVAEDLTFPLFVSAQRGRDQIVELLLKRKAAINAKFEGDATPLYIASENGELDVVQRLLRAGASFRIFYRGTWGPLETASMRGHMDVVQELMLHGANAIGAHEASQGSVPALRYDYRDPYPSIGVMIQTLSQCCTEIMATWKPLVVAHWVAMNCDVTDINHLLFERRIYGDQLINFKTREDVKDLVPAEKEQMLLDVVAEYRRDLNRGFYQSGVSGGGSDLPALESRSYKDLPAIKWNRRHVRHWLKEKSPDLFACYWEVLKTLQITGATLLKIGKLKQDEALQEIMESFKISSKADRETLYRLIRVQLMKPGLGFLPLSEEGKHVEEDVSMTILVGLDDTSRSVCFVKGFPADEPWKHILSFNVASATLPGTTVFRVVRKKFAKHGFVGYKILKGEESMDDEWTQTLEFYAWTDDSKHPPTARKLSVFESYEEENVTKTIIAFEGQSGDYTLDNLILWTYNSKWKKTSSFWVVPLGVEITSSVQRDSVSAYPAGRQESEEDIDETDDEMSLVCKRGQLGRLRALLQSGEFVDKRNKFDETPLVVATRAGQSAVVIVLLQARADVNITVNTPKTQSECNAIVAAAAHNDEHIVRLLCAASTTFQQIDLSATHFGQTAIDWAIENSSTEILNRLRAEASRQNKNKVVDVCPPGWLFSEVDITRLDRDLGLLATSEVLDALVIRSKQILEQLNVHLKKGYAPFDLVSIHRVQNKEIVGRFEREEADAKLEVFEKFYVTHSTCDFSKSELCLLGDCPACQICRHGFSELQNKEHLADNPVRANGNDVVSNETQRCKVRVMFCLNVLAGDRFSSPEVMIRYQHGVLK